MAQRLVIDPVTRVEGHLRVEAEVDSGVVKEAWVAGTVARGFEHILRRKDPRDVPQVVQRVCGLCAGSHGMGGTLALDSLLGVDLPENARLLRNLLMGADFISTHVLHFYQFIILDYLDISAILGYTGVESNLLNLKKRLEKNLGEEDAYPFKPSFGADGYTISDPALVASLSAHYFEALEMRKIAHQMGALLGGRMPGSVGVVPGGVTHLPGVDEINAFRYFLSTLVNWVDGIFLPDAIALATGPLLALGQQGVGKGRANFLSFGAFDLNRAGTEKLLPSGVIWEGNLARKEKVNFLKITEEVKHSWYAKASPTRRNRDENQYDLQKKGSYSFVKSPRYRGKSMEVGPLARMLVKKDQTLTTLMKDYGIQAGVLARQIAISLECKVVADAMVDWLDELVENTKKTRIIWDKREVPSAGKGVGLTETPSGALSHRIEVKRGRVSRYQLIAPTTWNASPRDEQDQRGPLEEALVGVSLPNPDNPLNILRVVHSFNLCMSCGAH